MKPILIVYATREGHTRHVATYIADALRARGIPADLRHAAEPGDLSGYSAAILAASVHAGRHEKEMEEFVVKGRAQLEAMPTAFLSVSLSEAGAEDPARPSAERAEASRQVAGMMDGFFQRTGWHPDRALGVAGALMYSEYNLIIRWVMKRIARKAGGSTDTSHDHVYTDWEALDRFVEDFVAGVS